MSQAGGTEATRSVARRADIAPVYGDPAPEGPHSNSVPDQPRILLVDSHPLLLDALERLLKKNGYRVIGKVHSGQRALRLLDEDHVDLVVVGLNLADMEGLIFLREIRRSHPDKAVVVFSVPSDDTEIAAALEEGAAAFVRGDADPRDLLSALRQAFRPSVFYRFPLADALGQPTDYGVPKLTSRELEIMSLVAEGMSNSRIAQALWVTEHTVKFHVSNVFRKLAVTNRTEAVRRAHLMGLLDLEEADSQPAAEASDEAAAAAG